MRKLFFAPAAVALTAATMSVAAAASEKLSETISARAFQAIQMAYHLAVLRDLDISTCEISVRETDDEIVVSFTKPGEQHGRGMAGTLLVVALTRDTLKFVRTHQWR